MMRGLGTGAITLGLLVLALAGPAAAGVAPDVKCKEKKATATGLATMDLLKAFGRNAKKVNLAKLGSDVSKAQSKLTKLFTKAEYTGKGAPKGCATTNDVTAVEAKIEAFVADVIGDIAPSCEVLNATECLLPYPSSHFLVPDPTTDTGVRVSLPQVGIPQPNGPTIPPDPLNVLDGFSPVVQIQMHFPQGVDPALSDAARLLPAGCCGQPAGPPWIDTRTYDARSLDADSPTILLDAGTGERIIHFIEPDARAVGNLPRQILFLRPGKSLTPGHRYIVAMRNLKDGGGNDVVSEAAFAALRDGIVTGNPAIDARRAYFEASIFPVLLANGIARGSLVLAFDFVVQSEDQLTRQMLSMRDQAYAWLATVEADTGIVPFTVNTVATNDCNAPGQVVWRTVAGTFQSPLFLDADLSGASVQFLNVDANDVPVQNGFTNPPFSISIPCSVLDPLETSRPLVLGHGLFGTGASMTSGIPALGGAFVDWTYIAGATDWRGLASPDLAWVGTRIIGIGTSQLHNFEAFPDRLRQGMLNTLVLARMMKRGIFNRHTAFETPSLEGVFPGAAEEMYYYGISLGGIMGTWLAALTPDIERFGVDVPAINFSCLLQRSTQFTSFEALISSIGLTDPMEVALGTQLLHELWVSAEPAGYARHITTDPLPGAGSASRILMTPAWLDKQVSNQCSEVMARTLGIPNLSDGSLVSGLQQIPDAAGPQDSAMVMYDTGSFDLFDPAHAPFIPALANLIPSNVCDPHGARPTIPASIEQLANFLQPGGQVVNFCNGICDAGDATETGLGNPPCDPTP
jgi:pimeloyl-ACP methyl ester carboxylesterase